MAYWLIKSEPFKYSWDQFIKDKRTFWDGVRNYGARNNLRSMKKGDLAFWYHSNEGMEIVGIAKVVKEAYQDPTTEEELEEMGTVLIWQKLLIMFMELVQLFWIHRIGLLQLFPYQVQKVL